MSPMMFSDSEIALATSYMKDDRYLASIYGVSVSRIKRIRSNREQKVAKSMEEKFYTPKTIYDSHKQEKDHIRKMHEGSEKLRETIIKYFEVRENAAS